MNYSSDAARRSGHDARWLFATRFVRLFAYGSLSVVLVFYLIAVGLTEVQTGVLLTLTLLGDAVVSLAITTRTDRLGRRRMLVGGALLMGGAGLVLASTTQFWLLLLAATAGVISPSGQEVGPFLPIEQAALTGLVSDRSRTKTFAWYTMTGTFATALGALAGGLLTRAVQRGTTQPVISYRAVVILYAVLGAILALAFSRLSRQAEAAAMPGERRGGQTGFAGLAGVEQSRHVVLKLSALFALDAFGGGFVAQSFAAYWFHLRFGIDPAALGSIFLWANIASRNRDPALPVQYQPDGRADQAVLCHGCCPSPRAVRGCRIDRSREDSGGCDQPRIRRPLFRATVVSQPAVLHCRNAQDRTRPGVV
jgi:MFS family permease